MCKHKDIMPRYDHIECVDCHAVRTDGGSEWKTAANKWFHNIEQAKGCRDANGDLDFIALEEQS